MNQIETLKWIAENGNPIGTEVESDYVKYKTDPTFRNLAMSLASSETGYAGLDDSTKNAYQTYKQSVETQSSKLPSLPPVPADTQSDYLFVGFANPTTLPKAQKAAEQVMAEQEQRDNPSPVDWSHFGFTNPTGETYEQLLAESPSKDNRIVQYIAKHPIETGAGLAAGLLTPGAGIPAAIAIQGLSAGAGNLADQYLIDQDTTRSIGERLAEAGVATGSSSLGTGLGYGLSAGLNSYAAPYFRALEAYASKTAAVQAFKDWLAQKATRKAGSMLFEASNVADDLAEAGLSNEYVARMGIEPTEKMLKDVVSSAREGKILDLLRTNEQVAPTVRRLAALRLRETLPEYKVFAGTAQGPTTGEVGRYILENTQNPVAPLARDYAVPDALKDYLARTNPGGALASKVPLVRNMATSIADWASPKLLSGARSLSSGAESISPSVGVASGILGSEATRSVQDLKKDLDSRFEMPPVY